MKRKPLFLISTLTLLGSFLWPTGAANATISNEGRLYYTADDLVAAGKEFESARIAACGEDYSYECSDNVLRQLSRTDRKFAIYDMFRNLGLLITAVDPGNNTARVVYRDKDEMPLMWGEAPKSYDLKELYLYWLDPSIDTEQNVILQRYIDSIRKDTYDPALVHVLFAGNQRADFGWLNFNEESVFPLNSKAGYSYTQNLHIYAKYNGESYGTFDLLSCFAGSYTEGKECVNVFGEDWSSINIQMARRGVEEAEQVEEEPEQQPDQSAEPEQSEQSEQPEEPEQPVEEPEQPEQPEESEQPDQPEQQAEEPSRSDQSSQSEQSETPDTSENPETSEEPKAGKESEAEKESNPAPGKGSDSAPALEPEEPTPEAESSAEVPSGSDETSSSEHESATEIIEEEIKIPTTADTGEATRSMIEHKEVTKAFPWWLIAAVSAFVAFGLGLIIPARKRKQE